MTKHFFIRYRYSTPIGFCLEIIFDRNYISCKIYSAYVLNRYLTKNYSVDFYSVVYIFVSIFMYLVMTYLKPMQPDIFISSSMDGNESPNLMVLFFMMSDISLKLPNIWICIGNKMWASSRPRTWHKYL